MSFVAQEKTSPSIEDVSKEVNARYELRAPSRIENRTNPQSESYQEVQKKIYQKISSNPNFKILYSSPRDNYKDTKKIVILIGDDHLDKELAVKQYQLLKDLYTDENLHLSSSFNEGKTSVESAVPTIPKDLSQERILADIRREAMAKETALLYDLRAKEPKASSPYLSYNPEVLNQAEDLDIMMDKLIVISSGLAAGLPDQQGKVFNSLSFEIHKINLVKLAYEHLGLAHEFYALLGARIKRIALEAGFDEATQRRIVTNSIDTLENFSEAHSTQDSAKWQKKYYQALLILNQNQSEKLFEYSAKKTQELTIQTRNERIASLFTEAEAGTRTMIVGTGHYRSPPNVKGLISLLEESNVPIIIIERKS